MKSHFIMESMDGFGPCVSENCSSENGCLMKTVRMICSLNKFLSCDISDARLRK